MTRGMRAVVLFTALTWIGCDCSGPGAPCDSDSQCTAGMVCTDGTCESRPDTGMGRDAAMAADDGVPDAGPGCSGTVCGVLCCADTEICRFDRCISDLGACTTNDDCWGDSYCVDGRCIPYGIPEGYDHDAMCTRAIDIGAITPEVQCRWTAPPVGDGAPDHVHVMATPVVVDFDFDRDPATLLPSIAFATFPTTGSYGQPGVLRVIDGASCFTQFSMTDPADAVMSPAPVAVGDLDGDGYPEIVAAGHLGGVKAFRYDAGTGQLARIWTSGVCDGSGGRTDDLTGGANQWNGPSIHDLDDDGIAEITYGGVVYDRDGCVLTQRLGFLAYNVGLIDVIADVDGDGRMELPTGDALYEFDPATHDWVAEASFTGTGMRGQVAVAELGDHVLASLGRDAPEIVIIAASTARVETIEGAVVFGPVGIPGGGVGGAPTVADFDGDGRREFATAGGLQYVVYDLDCLPGGPAGGCASGRTDGILWTQPSQDGSSNVTGSSVFDFDADGAAEAVYADECFLRIYSGADGTVLFSAARSSGTTYENPVIVDVDGDFHSEIVSAVNDYAGTLGCPATDPLRPASAFAQSRGIVVLRDTMDRWAASRPVWNQHAYAVTHVGDHGETPRTSAVMANWADPSLNNFRQNVQGSLDALGLADLTAASQQGPIDLVCDAARTATLPAQICNRGTLPLAAGTEIAFRVDAPDGAELCRAPVPVALTVGMCTEVTCTGTFPGMGDEVHDLYVVVDPQGLEEECWEGNNFAVLRDARCHSVE
ncbi:MAG: hypothetical protein AB7S26_29685 [Sandaracinaceae bacterium]